MDRLINLHFELRHDYEESGAGIMVPVRLIHGQQSVELRARVDTGAADCLFDRHYADILQLPPSRLERTYRTVSGSFTAYGHEVTVETLTLRWDAVVFFCDMGNPAHAFVGRRGWLDRVRLGLVHYEQTMYLGLYAGQAPH